MRVHLVDGTYELFRHFYGAPAVTDTSGNERGAVAGVVQTLLGMLEEGATHIGVATDHVIESFRNDLYSGYKTGEGIDPLLWGQFEPLEGAVGALGVVIWPMVEVEQVVLCTPDKDLAQCVRGDRVVQLDRRSGEVRNADGVMAKFGVSPASIPDYLALVGDSADGFPGLPGWGAKAASTVLARYGRLEDIPASAADWDVAPRGATKLALVLRARWEDAMLFRTLATLRTDQPVVKVDELEYRSPTPGFETLAASWGRPKLFARAQAIAAGRSV